MAQPDNAPSTPQRRVSIDGWVDTDGDAISADERARLRHLPAKEQRRIAKRQKKPGRRYDHLRSASPVFVRNRLIDPQNSPWRDFMQTTSYGSMPKHRTEAEAVAALNELNRLMPSYAPSAVVASHNSTAEQKPSRSQEAALHERLRSLLLSHPLIPTILRLIVFITCVISLAFAAKIYHIDDHEYTNLSDKDIKGLRPQLIVAIVVDSIVTPYVCYMFWDEWTKPPLGLRSPMIKISLTLSDLFFILFKAVSTTLAFKTLADFADPPPNKFIVRDMRILTAFQFIGLIAWNMNFTVNVFRLVERLGEGVEARGPAARWRAAIPRDYEAGLAR